MIIILAMLTATVLIMIGKYWVEEYFDFREVVGGVILVVGAMLMFMSVICVPFYISAGYKVEIINEKYGTNYTQAQVFFAESVIDEARKICRSRVELNGNLITGEDK